MTICPTHCPPYFTWYHSMVTGGYHFVTPAKGNPMPTTASTRKQSYKLNLRGVEWNLEFTKENLGLDEYGVCVFDNQRIIVEPKLKGTLRLDTVIHELLHACLPDTAEHSICQTASSIAQALVDMGLAKK